MKETFLDYYKNSRTKHIIQTNESNKKFENNFRRYLSEAKGMLDISIQNAKKFLTNDAKREEFLTSDVTVEHKTDGVKVTIVKKNNTGIAEEDYIVAYKNDIIYPDEFKYLPRNKIKSKSIGNSQFIFVWDHLIKLRKNNIPINTELFVEFLMKKPTLSSNYKKKHGMVLIGYSKSTITVKNGKLFTSPSGFFTEKRDDYAKQLKLDVPALLFRGVLGDRKKFVSGIKDDELKRLYRGVDINWDSKEDIINKISQMFLDVESKYGGREEGVVVKFNDRIIKFQQPYQTDQEARNKIKDQYRGTREYEDEYYRRVNKFIDKFQRDIDRTNFDEAIISFNKKLKKTKIDLEHIKKTEEQIKDDIALTFRMRLSKDVASGALILGKFRILTKAHYNMIKEAVSKYDTVTVNIVSSKETKGTKELRNEIMKHCFSEVEILNSSTGNIFTIMRKSQNEITTIIAGSDRVDGYRKMLDKNYGMSVYEIPRVDEDISATKVIENLEDYEYFKKNTPECSWKFYEKYLEVYK